MEAKNRSQHPLHPPNAKTRRLPPYHLKQRMWSRAFPHRQKKPLNESKKSSAPQFAKCIIYVDEMNKLRKALDALAKSLGLQKPLLARAQKRYLANRKRAFKANEQKKAAQKTADQLRAEGHPERAARKDKKALRLEVVATKNHQRAQFWLGRVKVLTQRVHELRLHQEKLEAQVAAIGPTISGNEATGGTKVQRLSAVALASAAECAAGRRHNFYSQSGAWDIDHCITGERYGERSDCSSWVTSVYKSSGLPDPNGEEYRGGYTGTLVAHGKQTNRDHLKPGDLVIYGSGAGHHVELFVGPGDKTIGHGSAPVDAGVIDLFGDHDYRLFTYPAK